MRTPSSKLRLSLVLALPLEIINFWVIGYPADTHSISRASQNAAVALQWYLLHIPGIILGDRVLYVRQHYPVLSGVLFLSGFIDTAIILLGLLWFYGLVRRTLRKLSSPLRQAA